MSNATLELAKQLIAVESLTPTHPATPPEKAANGLAALEIIRDAAKHATSSRILRYEGGDDVYPHPVDNLHLVYKSEEKALVRLLYLGHVDVFPAIANEWLVTHPFQPLVHQGNLYGRGAVDMKSPVAAFITSLEDFAASATTPYEVHVVITNDEEYAALNGVEKVLAQLKAEGLEFTAVFVGEPSSQEVFADTVPVGRRGSYNGVITVKGVKGHRAYQGSYRNALRQATAIAQALYAMEFATDPSWLASTDIEVNDIRTNNESTSGIPGVVTLSYNIRYTGNYTPQALKELLEHTLEPFRRDGFEVTLKPSNYPQAPYLCMPQGASRMLFNALALALDKHIGKPFQVTHSGGTSDGRYVQKYWPNASVIEFGPLVKTMHAIDEHIPLEHLEKLYAIIRTMLEEYFRAGNRRWSSEG